MSKSVYAESGDAVVAFYEDALSSGSAASALSATIQEFGVTKRSVVAFLSSAKAGKVYVSAAKTVEASTGGTRVHKIHLVREFAKLVGADESDLSTMSKMNKSEIEFLIEAVTAAAEAE